MVNKNIRLLLICLISTVTILGCSHIKNIIPDNTFSEDEEGLRDYLQSTRTVLSVGNSNNFEDLSQLTPNISNKSIFFTAEFHGFNSNIKLRMKFLKYFKHNTNFSYYLVELPYSLAHYLNEYLKTGDIKILNSVFSALKGSYAWNKDDYYHWIELYEYNKQLEVNDRIIVVGVDIEHQPYTAYRYMIDILSETEPPIKIKETVDFLKEEFINLNPLEYNYDKYSEISQIVNDSIEEYTEIYKKYLGDNFFGFKLVNDNVINLIISKKELDDTAKGWNNTRDKFIYENFSLIEKLLPEGKFYGQWGMNHTFQTELDEIMWFGAYLNSYESKYKGKIISIIYNYENSKYMKPNNGVYQEDDLFFVLPVLSQITSSFTDNYSLFNLNDVEDRPGLKMISFYTGDPVELDVSNFFQYVVLIKNSDATKPLGDL